MRRIAILAGVALAVTATTAIAQPPTTTPRYAVIYLTKNHDTMKYPADCLGSVSTEMIPSNNGDPVTWIIRHGNSFNNDDVCPGADKSKVTLVFKDDVFGTAVMKVLKATFTNVSGVPGKVWAIQGTVDAGIPPNTYGYTVYYNMKPAGPDPEIIVDCADCGGGGH
jgi:hypothetical protein